MARTTAFALSLGTAVLLTSSTAQAGWVEQSFDVVTQGQPWTAMQPVVAQGVDWPNPEELESGECALEPCALDGPVPVTRIAYIDTANNNALMLASRFGPPGEPWTTEMVWEADASHPDLILDRDGQPILAFRIEGTFSGELWTAHRTEPGNGYTGTDESLYPRMIYTADIDSPPRVSLQHYGWDLGVFDSLFRIHVVYSSNQLLRHAYLDWDDIENNAWFEDNPIGAYKNLQGTKIGWEEDEVMGRWPDAVGLWTDISQDEDDIFAYEEMPAVAYIRGTGLTFRRTEQPIGLTSPMYNWFDRQHLGSAPDMRPTIDAIRDGGPKVAWAPACPWGGNLLFRESETDNPNHPNEWLSTVFVGSENACDPEMSIGEYEPPTSRTSTRRRTRSSSRCARSRPCPGRPRSSTRARSRRSTTTRTRSCTRSRSFSPGPASCRSSTATSTETVARLRTTAWPRRPG